MPEQDHPSHFPEPATDRLFAGPLSPPVEGRSRSPVIKCSRCQLTFIGAAVPQEPTNDAEWVCPACAESD
jgi:hypothetical protein